MKFSLTPWLFWSCLFCEILNWPYYCYCVWSVAVSVWWCNLVLVFSNLVLCLCGSYNEMFCSAVHGADRRYCTYSGCRCLSQKYFRMCCYFNGIIISFIILVSIPVRQFSNFLLWSNSFLMLSCTLSKLYSYIDCILFWRLCNQLCYSRKGKSSSNDFDLFCLMVPLWITSFIWV